MAKRKRLSPLGPEGGLGGTGETGGETAAAPETKSMFSAPPRRAAPIADVAAGAAASAALEELSERWESARREGKLVLELPLGQIEMNHLVRDRLAEDPEEAEALRESLRARGQQTPIEVVSLPGRAAYGLLSGWRRCRALAALHAETGEPRFGTVQALLRRPEDGHAAYVAMIEENEIRANLSHYERARIVVKAAERGVFASEKEALAVLFAAVPRARRSKIGSFIGIVKSLDRALRFPEALSERAGLDLAQQLRERPRLAQEIAQALKAAPPADAGAERALLTRCMSAAPAPEKEAQTPVSEPKSPAEILARWPGLTLRRRGARLELDGPAADADLGADLAAWLAARMGG
ncbi:ParB N-terminal domain-containing protein [Salipiger mangrovisoli]|uniref:ParB N-terminal domain-containing protein n=1 Tax=Salipiger mangrovisoli TaxID=2865933 RepID=A0ABR9X9I9_9RHOB|nr:ParB N-terminal domain-containing protein [Salipiger mangrovisoli]MBE9640243.1 ParB N-terminal domain-containing protein [Salipiger mangrovisoli]